MISSKLASTIIKLEDDAGVIGKASHDGRIDFDEGSETLFLENFQHTARHFARAADEPAQLLAADLDLHAVRVSHGVRLLAQIEQGAGYPAGDVEEHVVERGPPDLDVEHVDDVAMPHHVGGFGLAHGSRQVDTLNRTVEKGEIQLAPGELLQLVFHPRDDAQAQPGGAGLEPRDQAPPSWRPRRSPSGFEPS